MGQMGRRQWQCTTTGLNNSTELQMEKIRQAVTVIWVPLVWHCQVWPTRPPSRPPGPWRQYPSSPEGWGVQTHRWSMDSPHKGPVIKKRIHVMTSSDYLLAPACIWFVCKTASVPPGTNYTIIIWTIKYTNKQIIHNSDLFVYWK